MESKIVVSLERISEAFRVLLWEESKEHGLSPIQLQILIFLLFHTGEKCKVSHLAKEFNLTRPTISDSVKVLSEKGLIGKTSDREDSRSYTISLTTTGKAIARNASLFASQIEKPLADLSLQQKEILLISLMQLIHSLNQAGIITPQRMCYTCQYYRSAGGGHYCNLLQLPLRNEDLRVDCPEHLMAI